MCSNLNYKIVTDFFGGNGESIALIGREKLALDAANNAVFTFFISGAGFYVTQNRSDA